MMSDSNSRENNLLKNHYEVNMDTYVLVHEPLEMDHNMIT